MTERSGLFLSFEGTEGSGKSTQIRVLVERLKTLQLNVAVSQEPGATRIGKEIRRILLDPQHQEIDGRTELLLMFASRTQAASEIIRPALDRAEVVVTDRFTDSTLAYQGHARGLGFELVRRAHQLALGDLTPDLTLFLSIDVEAGLARARHRNRRGPEEQGESRLDGQSLAFHERVREGYLRIAAEEPDRFRVIDAAGTLEAVAARIWAEIVPVLPQPASAAEGCRP